jgi:hypothetical protein
MPNPSTAARTAAATCHLYIAPTSKSRGTRRLWKNRPLLRRLAMPSCRNDSVGGRRGRCVGRPSLSANALGRRVQARCYFFAAHLYGPGYGRSEATKGSRAKRSVPVRLNKGRSTLLLQWPGLAQAPRRSWAKGLAARVEGREMLHEGTGLVRRSHLG